MIFTVLKPGGFSLGCAKMRGYFDIGVGPYLFVWRWGR